MADIRVYGEVSNSNGLPLAGMPAVGEARQVLSQEEDIMDDLAREQAQWRATILTFVVLVAVLGVEQVIPLSDALRTQIGVLTVLLTFGFWNLLCGMLRPRGHKG